MVVARGGFGQQYRGVFVEEPVRFHGEPGGDAVHYRPVAESEVTRTERWRMRMSGHEPVFNSRAMVHAKVVPYDNVFAPHLRE